MFHDSCKRQARAYLYSIFRLQEEARFNGTCTAIAVGGCTGGIATLLITFRDHVPPACLVISFFQGLIGVGIIGATGWRERQRRKKSMKMCFNCGEDTMVLSGRNVLCEKCAGRYLLTTDDKLLIRKKPIESTEKDVRWKVVRAFDAVFTSGSSAEILIVEITENNKSSFGYHLTRDKEFVAIKAKLDMTEHDALSEVQDLLFGWGLRFVKIQERT